MFIALICNEIYKILDDCTRGSDNRRTLHAILSNGFSQRLARIYRRTVDGNSKPNGFSCSLSRNLDRLIMCDLSVTLD